jgi:hypothetical protein
MRSLVGHIQIFRKIQINEFLHGDPVAFNAFMLLLMWARWRDDVEPLPKQNVILKRGQCPASTVDLCIAIWGPKGNTSGYRKKIERVILTLKRGNLASFDRGKQGTIVTIINYDKYQASPDDDRVTNGVTDGVTHGVSDGVSDGVHKKNSRREDIKNLREEARSPAHDRAVLIAANAIASLVGDLDRHPKPTLGESRDRARAAIGEPDWDVFSLAYPRWQTFSREYLKADRRDASHFFEGDVVSRIEIILNQAQKLLTPVDVQEPSHAEPG